MTYWTNRAQSLAKIAHEEMFPARWDADVMTAENTVWILNNCPYRKFPALRGQQLESFRTSLANNELTELAYATFPKSGCGKSYTYVVIVSANPGQLELVRTLYEESLNVGWN